VCSFFFQPAQKKIFFSARALINLSCDHHTIQIFTAQPFLIMMMLVLGIKHFPAKFQTSFLVADEGSLPARGIPLHL